MPDEEVQLTDEQTDALVLDRNVAITAGAGTGKTTTLTDRYVAVLEANPELGPEDVVTITFTRKAAAELTERVRAEVYNRLETADTTGAYHRWRTVLDELEEGYVHTIHAFCTRVLREHAVESPVPLGFDVLDEEDAATLQREVVTEFLERNSDHQDVRLLAQLWGRDQLIVVLTGLLDERPRSEAVLDHWRDADPADYVDVLWDVVCDLDTEQALTTLYDDGALTLIGALTGRLPDDHDVTDGDGLDALDELVGVARSLPEDPGDADPRDCRRAINNIYECCEKKNGGLYSSAGYVVGDRADWGDHGDLYDDLREAIDALIDAVQPYETAVETTPGELEANSAHYALALVRVFEEVLAAYEDGKTNRDALDFPDLIGTTVDFLTENDEVRAELREEFAAVLVDEFQDTDPRQWALVKALTGVDDGQADNVFLVGDEKQSIYGFRGADVTTFGAARDELQAVNEAREVDDGPGIDADRPTNLELSGNFRTLERPLEFLNELFDALFAAEGDDHAPFEAEPQALEMERDCAEDVDGLDGSVEYLLVPDDPEVSATLFDEGHPVADGALDHAMEAEAWGLAARLTELFDDAPMVQDPEDGEHRDARAEDVAILLRRRTHLDRYQRALEECDVPYTVVSGVGFYEIPEIRALVNLLRVLGDPTDDVSLYGILRSPLFGFTDDRLAPSIADASSVWEGIRRAADSQLADAHDLLTSWRTVSGCATPSDEGVLPWHRVLTRVIDDTGFLASVSADERGRQAVANVEKFRDQIRTWSENGIQTAAGLLHRIDRQSAIDPREGEADVPGDVEGVRIMTIHAAKGLEFPIVAVPDVGSRLNFGRSVDDHGYVKLVDGTEDAPPLPAVGGPHPADAFSVEKTAAHEYADRVSLPLERAEAKRLLYVACTRTRDHLLLSGTHDVTVDDETGEMTLGETEAFDEAERWRDWLQPLLLDDAPLETIFEEGVAPSHLGGVPYSIRLPPRPVDWREEDDGDEPLPEISIDPPGTTESAQRVSATALLDDIGGHADREADADDPVDVGGLQPQTFGTVVHRLAELRPPVDEWPSFIRQSSQMAGDVPTETDVEQVRAHARDAIDCVEGIESGVTIEAEYDEYSVVARIDGHRIVGDIDRLLLTPDEYKIVDYKTNDTTTWSTAALAEHYRPQMLAYALALLQHDGDRSVTATLRFTDAGESRSFDWAGSDRETLRADLKGILDGL